MPPRTMTLPLKPAPKRDVFRTRAPLPVPVPSRGGVIVLPWPPSVNGYWKGQGRRMFLSPEAKLFRAQAAEVLSLWRGETLTGPVLLFVDLYRPRNLGDDDNYNKAISDVLQGVAYVNDSQVTYRVTRKLLDRQRPRVEVLVLPVEACTGELEHIARIRAEMEGKV